MFLDWNSYQAELMKSIPDFAKASPESLKGYQTLSAANSKTSLLGEKARQLISIAVAVTTRCDGGIAIHTDAARKAGATLLYSLRALDSLEGHLKPYRESAMGSRCAPGRFPIAAPGLRGFLVFLIAFLAGRELRPLAPITQERARQGYHKKC